jgi:mono/diheme cytochrome c family protein
MSKTFPLWKTYFLALGVGLLALGLAVSLILSGLAPPDPYLTEVLNSFGNLERGQEIFQINCAVCHGIDGRGNIGPSLQQVAQRKSPTALIEQVISGRTPPMPQFQPNAQNMADLLSYLETL